MNKSFCEQIDRESLVEEYVRGKLSGELRSQFEQHLRECEQHTRAVQLERSLRNGVIEFARNQIRSAIRKDYRPQEDIRYTILRYAAFLLVALAVPLMLYYQFRIFQPRSESTTDIQSQIMTGDSSQKRTNLPDEKSIIPSTRSAPGEIVLGQIKKSEPVPPAVEPSTGAEEKLSTEPAGPEAEQIEMAVEKLANAEINQIAPISQGVHNKSSAESPQIRTQVVAPAMEDLNSKRAGGYPKKEQFSPVAGIIQPIDSSQNLAVFTMQGTAPIELRTDIADQITGQQADLLTCTTRQDTANFITVKFIITDQGLVEHLQVIGSNIPAKNIEECIIEKISHWKFTAPGQKTVVTKKINLQ